MEAGQVAGHPLKIIEKAVYRGPHLFSALPMIRIKADIGALEDWPSHRLPDFTDRLLQLLPGLDSHGCSYKRPGGFVRRLRDGTWFGHIVEHVALELQSLAGSRVTRGKTRSVRGQPGVYNILFSYEDEEVGLAAGAHAIGLVLALVPEELRAAEGLELLRTDALADPLEIAAITENLAAILRAHSLGPTTRSLVEEARRRGIPVQRLDDNSLVQLGQGINQRRIRASITGLTSQVAVDIAGNKDLTKSLLDEAGLPAPRGEVVRNADDAVREARRIRYPVVVKPLDGNHGRGVTIGIVSDDEVRAAFEIAARHSRRVVVEQQLPGNDHRILVVGGKVVAVAERVPAHVIGDGYHSIEGLIELLNQDTRRGEGHEKVLTRIKVDQSVVELLGRQGKTLKSVPMAQEVVLLRGTANLSTGGTAIDRTDVIHPLNAAIAEQAAAVVGLDVAGIDFLTPDITRPVRETGGGIVEVNAAPGFRMHLEPSEGKPREIAAPVIDALYPRRARSRIPIFAITGTNGKSTTTRMVARILCESGLDVGMTTTTGIYFNGHLMREADASGPRSARMVLRNPRAQAAVLETARGGMLREGLGFDSCDVGAVLNVTSDHLGLKGIDTVEDLACVKSIVVESVARRGHSVLNADDPLTVKMARHAGGRLVWFSLHGAEAMSWLVREHVAAGGLAVVREAGPRGGLIVVYRDGERVPLMYAAEIPATIQGMAEFNIANSLAAAAMCAAHGVPLDTIRSGLANFASSYELSPGRLNIHDGHPFRVIVDYAHNAAAMEALGDLIGKMRPDFNRVIGMANVPGDRRDEDIIETGRIAARIFDELVFRESPDGRGRRRGEVNALMSKGAAEAGKTADHIVQIIDEGEATDMALRMARPGDLVILLPTSVEKVWKQALAFEPCFEEEPMRRSMARA
jgi:cyanophycin synthetase